MSDHSEDGPQLITTYTGNGKAFDVFYGYITGQWFVKEQGQEEELFFQDIRDARKYARKEAAK